MTVYFTDRDLGKRVPEILTTGGLTVHRHMDHFAHDTGDDVWLQAVGANGWVAITRDTRIRYKPNELAAVTKSNARLLVLIGKASFPVLACNFVNTIAKIEEFVMNTPPPFIAKVYRPSARALQVNPNAAGSITKWYP